MVHSRAGLAAAVLLAAAARTAWAQPANDNFPGTTLTGSTLTAAGSNVGATAQAGEPNPAGVSGASSVWWSWTAPASGSVMITTAGSSFDTTLGVYTGSIVTALSAVAQNDDGPFDLTSQVTFTATSGVTYRVQVNGFLGETGAITLNLTSAASGSVVWNTPPPGSVPAGSSFSVTWTVSSSSTSTNVRWDLFDPPSAAFASSNQSGAGMFGAALTAPSAAGTWYYQARALIGGVEFSSSVVAVSVTSSAPPPTNDDFPGETLSGPSVSVGGTNAGATFEAGEPDPDGVSGTASVWWTWTATSDGPVTITTAGSGFDTTLGVYTGSSVNALAFVAENDDATLSDVTSAVTFTATAGVAYQIQVNGFLGETGNIVLSVNPPSGGGGGGGGRCGLMGVDVLLALALLRRKSRG